MAHVESSLGIGEEVIAKASINKINVVVRGIIAGLWLLVFLVAGLSDDNGMVVAIGVIIAILIVLKPIIAVTTTELAVTNKRVIGKTGLVSTHSMDAPLNKINNITSSKKLLGAIFNYSQIVITTSSGSFKFDMIKDGEIFKQTVSRQIEVYDEERIKKQAKEMAAAMKTT